MAKDSKGRTIYHHHITYAGKNSGTPVSVTSTNTETGKSRTYSARGGGGGSSSGGSSSSGSSAKTDYATKYANNKAYQSLVGKYGADNVHSALDYMTSGNNINKSTLNSILSKKGGTSGSLGGNGTSDSYTEASISNYNNAINHLKSQGMSDADAKSAASGLLEKSTLNTKSQQQKAEEMSPFGFDNDDENGYNEYDEYNDYLDNYDANDDVLWDYMDEGINDIRNTVDDFINSYDKQETTTENKAEVSHDPIFDYNTYFQNNIVGDTAKVGETGQQAEQPAPSTDLTDITADIEGVTQSLQNLGFLEPNGEATASMPDTQEQADIKTYENPESIVDDFNQTIQGLTEEGNGLAPQAGLETYKDFRNRLQKFRDDNNLTDEQYNEFLKQLQSNEELRNALVNYNK